MKRADRILLERVIDELNGSARGSCYCDEPPPGEQGKVECTPCRDHRLAKALMIVVNEQWHADAHRQRAERDGA